MRHPCLVLKYSVRSLVAIQAFQVLPDQVSEDRASADQAPVLWCPAEVSLYPAEELSYPAEVPAD
jgi:hypothetical protein